MAHGDTTETAASPRGTAPDIAELARDAFVWGFPLLLFGRYLEAALQGGVPYNRFFMNTEVATPQSAAVGPNIDTLNGRAWLDLDVEPQVIVTPDTDDRYYTIQLQDMYMNSFAYIGRRTTGTAAGAFAVTPPGFIGSLPAGVAEIKSPTSKVLAFVRTLVRGRQDLAAVREINAAFTLGPLSTFPEGQRRGTVGSGALDAFQPDSRRTGSALPHQDIANKGAGFLDELDAMVRVYPPLPWDAPNLARFSALGFGETAPAKREANIEAALAAAVPAGLAAIARALDFSLVNGWSRRPNVAPFVCDPAERAANNLYGPGTQVAEESVFFNMRQGPDGKVLNGANGYRLRFPAGQTPPVDAFWSLTLYDNAYVLFDNPMDRYGITDRTEGLIFAPDGSLEIQLQATRPPEGGANWLPTPRDAFQLVMRTYQPRQAILDGSYCVPPLEMSETA